MPLDQTRHNGGVVHNLVHCFVFWFVCFFSLFFGLFFRSDPLEVARALYRKIVLTACYFTRGSTQQMKPNCLVIFGSLSFAIVDLL